MIYRMLAISAGATALFAAAATASPPDAVDTAIVLAADVSGSVSQEESRVQKRGHVEALRSPDFINAIKYGKTGCIAIAYVEWSGNGSRTMVLPWTRICNSDAAGRAADLIQGKARPEGGSHEGGRTSLSYAIDASSLLLSELPFHAERKVIDISTDGSNNDGLPVSASRDRAITNGFVVNAILLTNFEEGLGTDLDTYFRHNVIGGPRSFVTVAGLTADYSRALLRKLMLEIS